MTSKARIISDAASRSSSSHLRVGSCSRSSASTRRHDDDALEDECVETCNERSRRMFCMRISISPEYVIVRWIRPTLKDET